MSGKHEQRPLDQRDVDHATYVAGLRALMDGPQTGEAVTVRAVVRCSRCGKQLGTVEQEPRQTVFHTRYGALLETRRHAGKRTPPTYAWGKWRLEPAVQGEPATHCPKCGPRTVDAEQLLGAVSRSRRNEREQRGRGTVTLRV